MTYRLYDPLLEKIQGQVICLIDGVETAYDSAKELSETAFQKRYVISEIRARQDRIVLVLTQSADIPNDLSAEWAVKQMEETHREISFF